jgi:hypothetical protein
MRLRRVALVSLVSCGLVSEARAQDAGTQDPDRWTVEATVGGGKPLALGYYLTETLSLRSSVGAGWGTRVSLDAGLELRFEPLARDRFSPFASASADYLYNSRRREAWPLDPHSARFGIGLGLRVRTFAGWSLVARSRYTTLAFRDPGRSVSFEPHHGLDLTLGLGFRF